MSEAQDLDPQEALELGHDPETDISTEAEIAEATTREDEQYAPEEHNLPGIDQDWDADEHGSMADHATDDDEVEMEDPDTVYTDEETE